MPCGGIWTPEPGSHWLQHPCWVCQQMGCELFVDEWDTTLHVRCLGAFLQTDEGKCVLLHGHGISIPDREDGTSWAGVELNDVRPGSDFLRLATSDEQRAAILAWARNATAQGAGHDCAEWRDAAGICALCGSTPRP